jgi:superfamily II DNA or RNA helicase
MVVLRDYQDEGVNFLAARKRGMLVAPAGSGKTVIGASALARVMRPGMKVVWIGNTLEQVAQAGEAIGRTPGPDNVDIQIVCAASNPDVSDADIVVFDECHHIPAESWLNILAGRAAHSGQIVWGLTATPWHQDEARNETVRRVFQEFHTIERARVLASGHLVEGKVWMHDVDAPGQFDEEINARVEKETKARVRRFPALRDDGGYIKCSERIKLAADDIEKKCGREFLLAASRSRIVFTAQPQDVQLLLQEASDASRARDDYVYRYHESKIKWQVTQEYVQASPARNSKIVALANQSADSTLVLIHSIEHGEFLATAIPGALVVHSKMGAKKRKRAIDDFRSGTLRVMISTSLADEGLDVPRASCLILAAGGRSAGKLEQRAGRVLRPFEGKASGVIHDFMDRGCCFALAQARARMKVYENLGYEPDILPSVSAAA